jgi:hypothetical protein
MVASAEIRAVRPRAQRFELSGSLLKFCDHLAVVLPDERQIVVRCLAAAIKTAAPRIVLGLDTLVVELDPIQALPELLVEPIRPGLFRRNHDLPRRMFILATVTLQAYYYSCVAVPGRAATFIYFAAIEPRRDAPA